MTHRPDVCAKEEHNLFLNPARFCTKHRDFDMYFATRDENVLRVRAVRTLNDCAIKVLCLKVHTDINHKHYIENNLQCIANNLPNPI